MEPVGVGVVVGGSYESILIRENKDRRIEIGDLLVAKENDRKILLKVSSLRFGEGEENHSLPINYAEIPTVATARPVIVMSPGGIVPAKIIPRLGSEVVYASRDDLEPLTGSDGKGIYLGKLRSGSKIIDLDLFLNGEDLFTQHVLVAATTGRGKSNLLKTMIWSALSRGGYGILVLDSHDEYYGRSGKGVKDHESWKQGNMYFSTNPPPGASSLVFNLSTIEPDHFFGIMSLTDAQKQAMIVYNREYGDKWLEKIVIGQDQELVDSRTARVLRRKFRLSLGIYARNGRIVSETNAFSQTAGSSTIKSIVSALESGKVVILDTSRIGDEAELLIGSIVATEVFSIYRDRKGDGTLDGKAPVSILIEEAPRVLSEEKIEEESNIFASIAREGRKFRVGLIAVTQIVSLIPKSILTNLNTKIILGNEMSLERKVLLESCSNDLSFEDTAVASLDRGEAIVSSILTKFGIPIYTPLFGSSGGS